MTESRPGNDSPRESPSPGEPVSPSLLLPVKEPAAPIVPPEARVAGSEKKRRLVRAASVPTRPGCVLAVGGGKGGIGKSLIAANLGIELARRGKRVVLIDADLGGANLHTCLGVQPPKVTLSDFIDRKVGKLNQVVVPAGLPNLGLVSGALDSLDVANPRHGEKVKLLRNLRALPVDFVLLDLGAGTSYNVLDFFLTADHGILVLVPEPTSVENGYRFIKAAFFRRLAAIQAVYGIEDLVTEAMSRRQENGIKTPYEVIAAVHERDPAAGENLEREMGRFRPGLIVNQARSDTDREVGNAVVAAWHKYFGLEMDYLGAIGYDDEVWKAVRKRRPVLLESPGSETAVAMARIADRLLQLDGTSGPAQAVR
ncbi:MAG: P-loop NTPase [Deltaproteobacteria bacterium]|nr:P-loop NTPase [Deltaproteobacteria bacterium]